MNLLALPAFADNCIWMLHEGVRAVVVDPGDAGPVLDALDRHRLQLARILVTHHHADHSGGVDALRPRLQGPVYGPAREQIPAPFTPLQEGDMIEVPGQHFRASDVPSHTAGHIAYSHIPYSHIAYMQQDAAQAPQQYRAECEALRARGTPTLPSSIGQECSINPFLGCAEPAVVRAAQAQGAVGDSPVAVLAALREWKNRF